MKEKIAELMRKLDITEEEAIELIEEDKKVDRMKMSEIDNDLNAEQAKAVKDARRAERKKSTAPVKRERKTDDAKRELIEKLADGLEILEIINPEREFLFMYKGTKYKVVLSCPRK